MTTILRTLLVLLGLLALPAAAADEPALEVKFLPYEQYLDVGDRMDGRDALQEIEKHLKQLGRRYLQPGQHLLIEVLEIDLAGRLEMVGRQLNMLRVLRGKVDSPRLLLRYSLQAGDKVLQRGEDTLTDMMYLDHIHGGFVSQSLYYEKQLLDAWFNARFAAPAGEKPAHQ